MIEQLYYLGFAIFPGIGPAKFQVLLSSLGSAEKAWKGSLTNFTQLLGEKLAAEFIEFREKFDPEKYALELKEKGIGYVTFVDEEYPQLLRNMVPLSQGLPVEGSNGAMKQLSNLKSPFVVFYKGDPSLFASVKSIGIVGTRSISEYGKEVTRLITTELVEQGFVIVSGLALGVDGIAHQTCLDHSGKTIAVLGSGVDICTPSNHQKLYDRILATGGLIVSTVPPGEEPNKGSFPARNKIIAGLSLGVVVTEGTSDSGALYTADFAKKMMRPVFSVPGPITSRLSGATTKLLKDGAVVVTSGKDIVDTLGIIAVSKSQAPNSKSQKGDTPEEQEIIDLLQIESLHFNEIVRKIGKDSKKIGSLLTLLELKGLVRGLGDGKYSLD